MSDSGNDRPQQESRKIAEESREASWKHPSFLRGLFLGKFDLDLIHPFPDFTSRDKSAYQEFYNKMKSFLQEEVDSDKIDSERQVPPEYYEKLKGMGAFGMKIDKKYGGLGFSQAEYNEILKLLSSVDGSLTALLSAHQSIGVPQPIKLFGTDEQKKKYLPRVAKSGISAFALTEPEVGSDPASLKTTVISEDDDSYTLNGEKLWCTNATIADVIIVMARHEEDGQISAFIVEAEWEGVEVKHRCHFMGLNGIENGIITFRNVHIPNENLIGNRGKGLKLALTTLNTGRLSLPAASVGASKACLEISRRWASQRNQWGQPIGKHEIIAHKLSDMAANVFAMESVIDLASAMADQDLDIRLEAAVAKLYNTEAGWKIVDDTMQIRGGRGYETAESLRDRGEAAIPVERIFRDSRINTIFEGSSEIMRLFIAREAVDKHLKIAGDLIDPDKSLTSKLSQLPVIAGFYGWWYPKQWIGWRYWPKFSEFGKLAKHLRFIKRSARRLARNIFHGMIRYGGKLQYKQAFLFRAVDIGAELFAMAATVSRGHKLAQRENPEAVDIADLFCENARRKIQSLFKDLWSNDDVRKYLFARRVLDNEYNWVEDGTVGLNVRDRKDLLPESVTDLI